MKNLVLACLSVALCFSISSVSAQEQSEGIMSDSSANLWSNWKPYEKPKKEKKYKKLAKKLQDSVILITDYQARFTSTDPLWEKYRAWSPYQYGANNPLVNIDPNGKEIWLASDTHRDGDGNMISVQYKNGKLFNKDGSAFKGKDKFLNQTLGYLNRLRNSGNQEITCRLGQLETSKISHFINQTTVGKYYNPNTTQVTSGNDNDAVNRIPTSGTSLINYNAMDDSKYATLAHEVIGHLFDLDNGSRDSYGYYSDGNSGIEGSELDAVNIENVVRANAGLPKRTSYNYGQTQIPAIYLWDTHRK
jgi:hypothetical protein